MEILALDAATRLGWAHTTAGRGVLEFKNRRGESPGMRWVRFRVWLDTFVVAHETDLIVYELEGAPRSRAAAHVGHGFITVIEQVAAERGLDLTNVAPKTLKKWATGKGNAGKDAMVDAACIKARAVIEDDNEADAFLLLQYTIEQFGD